MAESNPYSVYLRSRDLLFGPGVIGMSALTLALVTLRITVRIGGIRRLFWDDYLIMFATLCYFLSLGMGPSSISLGDVNNLDHRLSGQGPRPTEWQLFSELLFLSSQALTIASVYISLIRFFMKDMDERWKWTIYFLFGCVVNISIASSILPQPGAAKTTWYQAAISGSCWLFSPQLRIRYYQEIIGAVIYILILTLLTLVLSRNVPTTSKVQIGVCCCMGSVFFTTAYAVAKLSLLHGERMRAAIHSTNNLEHCIRPGPEDALVIMATCIPAIVTFPTRERVSWTEQSDPDFQHPIRVNSFKNPSIVPRSLLFDYLWKAE